jgi:DNA-binding NarL/FixJ family response regulator
LTNIHASFRANHDINGQSSLPPSLPRHVAMAGAARRWTHDVLRGARPRRAALHGPEALTPSEGRVADLAAAGSANRDIAQALFVTVRTVELHFTHVYAKLGIKTRGELAQALNA